MQRAHACACPSGLARNEPSRVTTEILYELGEKNERNKKRRKKRKYDTGRRSSPFVEERRVAAVHGSIHEPCART